MAIRYSGDVEIRMTFSRGNYRVKFRSPGYSGEGTLTPRECQLSQKDDPASPESYDKVARRVLAFLKLKGVQTGELRRLFQAPCPIPVGIGRRFHG